MNEICPTEQCTGCEACFSACSSGAITMTPDVYGFYYPQINRSKCIDCGLCAKICPNNTNAEKYKDPYCYVGHASNIKEQLSSSSGGVASALSRLFIKKGGVVYGCTALGNCKILHIRIDNESDLELLKGSKYVQSKIGGIYNRVKADLLNGYEVLFIGTPCQISGLKSYLRKDYDNLFTVDFVCHGVPSEEYLRASICVNDITQQTLSFRRKIKQKSIDIYKSQYGVFLKKNDKYTYIKNFPYGLYIAGFLNALFYRESCYQCHYTTPHRISDFTLGDYDDKENDYVGLSGHNRVLSMIMANSTKAKMLMNELNEVLEYLPVSLNVLIDKHNQLEKPMPKHKNYNLFRQLYLTQGFEKAVRSSLNLEYKNIILDYIRVIAKQIPGVDLVYRKLYNK